MVNRIKQYLHTEWMGTTIVYEEEMDSTNLRAKLIADENVTNGTLVVAKRQTLGRGRLGRQWCSPEGNAYFSLMLNPDVHTEYVSRITLVAALALEKSLSKIADLPIRIKWPNDIVVSGRKLCGILTEAKVCSDGLEYVIVGVGINANQKEFDASIRDMATSLLNELGREVDIPQLIAEFLNEFEVCYNQFLQTQDLSLLLDDYNRSLVHYNQPVRVIGEDEMIGISKGISESGALLLQTEDGRLEYIIAGELSVRGLYGYV
ncbi:MAG: biotin--[acetyl-CoA-carboxylase] ligase [Lachnospiraceae bacterium]|nr:biotin--[acetyl-CoA-carboxylase] ligase [Lachnospiraceae bacterium]